MINGSLDFLPFAQQLAVANFTQIPTFLQADAAERLASCLEREVPYQILIRDEHGQRALDLDQSDSALASARAHAEQNFAFAYEGYQIVEHYLAGRNPDHLLHRVLDFFNTPDYLSFARKLTQTPSLRRIDAQATRYRAGHFLKAHDDHSAVEQRRFAYVLNLTRNWSADRGGLLQLLDSEGRVTHTLMPLFNSLSVFRVPQMHCVSAVAPYAKGERLAITGWLQD